VTQGHITIQNLYNQVDANKKLSLKKKKFDQGQSRTGDIRYSL